MIWQVNEERIDDNWSSGHTTDRIVQHVWGLRYIDDLVLNRQDSNADGDYTDSSDFTHYALTDHQFSVIALIDSAGNLIERVSYTPYGEARHHWRQDVDGDGDIDATDQTIVTNAQGKRIYESGYNVDADFNRDGIIDSNDSRQIGSGAFRAALPAGWISSLTTGNVIGFSGYVFNREIDAGGLYTVRFRHYDPVWGRWISRDPAGYQDSMSLYGYGWGSPADGSDPFGESWNPFTREYWYYFKEGWLETRDYWYDKGPVGKTFFWGTHVIVGGFLIYAGGAIAVKAVPVALRLRMRIHLDPPHHMWRIFGIDIGKFWHLQLNIWIKSLKGFQWAFRLYMPKWLADQLRRFFPAFLVPLLFEEDTQAEPVSEPEPEAEPGPILYEYDPYSNTLTPVYPDGTEAGDPDPGVCPE